MHLNISGLHPVASSCVCSAAIVAADDVTTAPAPFPQCLFDVMPSFLAVQPRRARRILRSQLFKISMGILVIIIIPDDNDKTMRTPQ